MDAAAIPSPVLPRRRAAALFAGTCEFDDVATALLFMAIALAACLIPAQNDTWWLLRAGEDTWTTGRAVLRETYSHTVHGSPWPNHEWLSQALFFGVYRAGGMPLLTLMAAAAVIASWAIVWRLAPGPARGRFVLVAFVLLPSSGAWTIRPQVLTLLCLAVALHLVAHRRLLFLPGLMLVWANLHGGFVLGVVVLAASVLSALLIDRRRLPAAAAVAAISILVTLANPLGPAVWLEIPGSLARLRAYDVIEWRPPALTDPIMMPFWVAAAAVLCLFAKDFHRLRRSADADSIDRLAVCLTAIGLVPLALRTGRNVPPFLLAAVPAAAAMWPASWWPARRQAREHHALNRTIVTAAGAALIATVVAAYAKPAERLRWTPLPQRSLDALAKCEGPLYNRYDEGGYLIWFARGRRVFMDSRQDPYPPALVHEQIAVERTGDYQDLFSRYSIACAFVDARSPVARRLRADGWSGLYDDGHWAVFAP
jgi:hypothetical protein